MKPQAWFKVVNLKFKESYNPWLAEASNLLFSIKPRLKALPLFQIKLYHKSKVLVQASSLSANLFGGVNTLKWMHTRTK